MFFYQLYFHTWEDAVLYKMSEDTAMICIHFAGCVYELSGYLTFFSFRYSTAGFVCTVC